jgi:hypothetical protein
VPQLRVRSVVTVGLGRAARAGAIATALGIAIVVFAASPASAHGVGGIQPTNYRTTVGPVTPRVQGVTLESVDLGNGLELQNTSVRDVVVRGYDGEPYLRVGPRGVFENTRSPATYLNRTSTTIPQKIPAIADANAVPVWRKISSSTTARWHDHRAHWMGTSEPPAVQRDPGATHVVQRFAIRLRESGRNLTANGVVEWVPGPSPWPWIAFAVLLVISGFAVARTRRWARWTGVALAILMVAEAVHVIGVWGATTQSQWSDLAQSAYSIGGIALGALALTALLRRGGYSGAPLTLCAGLFLGIAGGLADVTTLSHSQLPTTLPDGITRLAVATVLGLGGAVSVVAALHLRAQPRARVRRPARPVTEAAVDGQPTPSYTTTAPATTAPDTAPAAAPDADVSALRAAVRERSHGSGGD